MAMTLRLSEDETAALRRQADSEGRSMQDVAKRAIHEYLDTHGRRAAIDKVLDSELVRYAEAIERLSHQ